jgi:hypothetical protein
MAIADFIPRRAGNSIEAVPEPQLAQSQPQAGSTPDRAAPPGAASAAPASGSASPTAAPDAPARKPLPARSEPATIAANYYVEEAADRRTYYQDYQRKAVAFTATESRVTSAREDLRTVRDMVEVAQARGWRSVQLRGTETFRREAWIEAAAAGLDATGYKASDPDHQEAERRKGERPANAIAPGATAPSPADRVTPIAAVVAGSALAATVATAGRTGSVKDAPIRPTATDGPSPSVAIATPAPATPATPAEQRKALRMAEADLSSDGKLILAALSEKIDRQMNRYNSDAKAELKLFVATELQAKERTQGPVQLSAEQRRMASAPEQGWAAGTGNVEALSDIGRDPGRDAGRDAGRVSTATPPPNPSYQPEQPRLTRSR